MSIVFCQACGKKISDKATLCGHCGFQREEVSEEQLAKFQLRKARDRIYRLNMASYAVISFFVAGFGWYWWETSGYTQPSSSGPFILMAISAIAYLVVRGLLFQAKRQLKILRQSAP
jgi:ribosomal protein L37E